MKKIIIILLVLIMIATIPFMGCRAKKIGSLGECLIITRDGVEERYPSERYDYDVWSYDGVYIYDKQTGLKTYIPDYAISKVEW